jgi:glycosyltransferase involved in cell wall biosynthesis
MERALRLPRVSICIPTYCQIEFLRETLISIQVQNFDDYEVIVSDDSPDDAVAELVASFNFNGKLRYYHNPVSLGSPENWNQAVRLAKGDYIKLLHHDDKFVHSAALSTFVHLLDEHPEANFAFGASGVNNVVNGKSRIHRPTEDQLSRLLTLPEELFFGNVIGAPSSVIYRNGLNLEYDKRMKWLVDIDFYIQLLQQNRHFIYSPEVLVATTSGASHQITDYCSNNIEIEFYEYLLLYKKVENNLKGDSRVNRVWFGLFEKYRIYSQKNLEQLSVKSLLYPDIILEQFFNKYQKKWLFRFPNRIFLRLPEPLKAITIHLRKLLYLCLLKK